MSQDLYEEIYNTIIEEDITIIELEQRVKEYIKNHIRLYAFLLKEKYHIFKSVDDAELFTYEKAKELANDYFKENPREEGRES